MKNVYLCWVDDIKHFVNSYNGIIELLELDYDVKFDIDEHNGTKDFDTIARNIDNGLIFLIDYNLKGHNGEGLDGHEVIKIIREHNTECLIVFYSSKATQLELRELVKSLPNVLCIIRESLKDTLTDIATGDIYKSTKT